MKNLCHVVDHVAHVAREGAEVSLCVPHGLLLMKKTRTNNKKKKHKKWCDAIKRNQKDGRGECRTEARARPLLGIKNGSYKNFSQPSMSESEVW
jgi:hypothetical protein